MYTYNVLKRLGDLGKGAYNLNTLYIHQFTPYKYLPVATHRNRNPGTVHGNRAWTAKGEPPRTPLHTVAEASSFAAPRYLTMQRLHRPIHDPVRHNGRRLLRA